MKARYAITALYLLGVSALQAQTCASPIPAISNSIASGDTCTASNSLPSYGIIPSPQNEIIYSFVAVGVNAIVSISHAGPAFGATVFLMPTPCSSSTDPVALGDFATPMVLTGLNDGQTYYLIVTADPGAAPDACGAYNLVVTGPIPVELQEFTIE